MELGLGEIMLILFVALMVYGGRLPKVALAVGRSIGELKRGLRETSDMVRREIESADPRPPVRRAWREAEAVLDDAVRRSENPGGEPRALAPPAPETPRADTDPDPGNGRSQ